MPDITQWLQGHGLAEYAGLFAMHRIGLDELPETEDTDLKELGILVGDRKRLL